MKMYKTPNYIWCLSVVIWFKSKPVWKSLLTVNQFIFNTTKCYADSRLLHRLLLVLGTCMYQDAACTSVCKSLALEDTINMVLSATVIDHSGQDAAQELLKCIHDTQ